VTIASSTTFAAAASALNEARAMERTRSPDDVGRSVMALSSIAEAQLALGLSSEAVVTLADAPQIARRLQGYQGGLALRTLGAAQAKAGLRTEAGASFDQALEAMQGSDDQWLRANEPLLVGEVLLKASMAGSDVAIGQALRATQNMRDSRLQTQALASIAATQGRAGLTEDARRTFERALLVLQSIGHPATRNGALLFVAGKFAEVGMEASAIMTLDQALQVAL
jgi:tetratricopeptide (TPR) repeat protein